MLDLPFACLFLSRMEDGTKRRRIKIFRDAEFRIPSTEGTLKWFGGDNRLLIVLRTSNSKVEEPRATDSQGDRPLDPSTLDSARASPQNRERHFRVPAL